MLRFEDVLNPFGHEGLFFFFLFFAGKIIQYSWVLKICYFKIFGILERKVGGEKLESIVASLKINV